MSVSLPKSVREFTLVGALIVATIALPTAAVSAGTAGATSGAATSSYLAGPIKLS